MPLTIHDILQWLNLDLSLTDHPVRDFVIDSRLIEAGDLFIALKGESADGHEFVRHAFERKACAALVSKDFAGRASRLFSKLIPVDDPLQALQKLATVRRKQFQNPVIAVTGTNGKTTTKEMTALVLSEKYQVHKTEANLNNHIGLPITILRCPDEAEVMVLEFGMNHAGELSVLADIASPTHGVITNIGRGHLGYFESVENCLNHSGLQEPPFSTGMIRFYRNTTALRPGLYGMVSIRTAMFQRSCFQGRVTGRPCVRQQ